MKRAGILLSIVSCAHTACAYHLIAQQTGPASELPRPTVGAIRWDGWIGDRGVAGKTVQETLGPAKWHYRLPFFAKIVGDNKVEIDGSSQAVVDREIEYAAAAGLDYWAFVTYSPDDPLSLALDRYLNSPIRSKIRFCLIAECERWCNPAFVDRVVRLMQEPGYQTVLDRRPMLYFGFIEEEKLGRFGGIEGLRKSLDAFRARIAGLGLGRPYIVVMDFDARLGRKCSEALGCDAISSYATGWGNGRIPYARWAGNTEAFWEQCRATGSQVVPIVMTGWDPRPRVEKPIPWGNPYTTHDGQVNYSQPATPAEIADHLRKALDWLHTNRLSAAAQTAIIYAWNEFDEGGWLAPTLAEGTARLDAIGKVLRPSRSTSTNAAPPGTAPGRP